MQITEGGLDDPRVVRFLGEHLDQMREISPPESVHALDLDGLRAPGMRFWSVWADASDDAPGGPGTLLATAALKTHDAAHGELKSMRTAAAARGRGVASTLLLHVLDAAADAGMRRVSLETGAEPFFEAARRMYRRHGFVECGPFASYVLDPNSVFMTREV
ncbi:GNAT family N-acetyltransferase [Luteimicrobium subarcticum]|uniref:GNAT family N-acetyltransferase n=1 Tax=Luteimicrobium subarcticum TaxID=620910 RepID=UPI001FE586AE|nr:GNAT family N-acetyltransferase [Luteimicrobium subarcticum]